MIKKYQEKLNVVRLLFLLLLFLGGMLVMRYSASHVASYNQSHAILDLLMGYSFNDCRDYLFELDAGGREIYRNEFFVIDFVYLMIYNTFYFSVLLYLLRFVKLKILRLVLIFPFCSLLFDLGENLIIRHMIANFPNISQSVCEVASLFTVLKFISVYSSLAFTFILVAVSVGKIILRKRGNTITDL